MKLEEFLTTDLQIRFGKTKDEVWRNVHDKTKVREFDGEYEVLSSLRDCYLIQDILKRHPDVLGRHLDELCQKCGAKEVYCGHIDLGRADYDDNFWHICLHCLDARHKEKFEESGYESEEDTYCPFCGYVWY
jgi:hypothetical protein